MIAKIVPVGNSKGIRIPLAVLRQCEMDEDVAIEVVNKEIVIKPLKKNPRPGWREAFNMMHKRGDDKLLAPDALDMDVWEWK